MGKTVLILGGGVGGLVAANDLRKRLPDEHRVVLVEREAAYLFTPSLPWLVAGGREASQITRPLARLSRKGIEVVRGELERIDAAKREVVVNGRAIGADFLIVALGAELAPDLVPGLDGARHDLYTLAGAEGFRDALAAFPGGRVVVLTAAMGYKCPAAPYEFAMLAEAACRKRGVRPRAEIEVWAAEPAPMAIAGPEPARAVREMIEKKGIGYHPGHPLASIDPAARSLRFANGAETTYDLLGFVPPHRAPRVVRESGLCADGGWIAVDRHTMETKWERVWALGDVVSIPLALGKPLPRAGVFAHGQAEIVAKNVARAVTGKGKGARFDGDGECFVECGDGKAGFGRGNFYAEPAPSVKMHAPSRAWHAAKVLFEKDFLRRWL